MEAEDLKYLLFAHGPAMQHGGFLFLPKDVSFLVMTNTFFFNTPLEVFKLLYIWQVEIF